MCLLQQRVSHSRCNETAGYATSCSLVQWGSSSAASQPCSEAVAAGYGSPGAASIHLREHLDEQEELNPTPVYSLADSSSPCQHGAKCVHLSPSGRGALVDWMTAACSAVGCCNDVLFSGVALLDRWLARAPATPHFSCSELALGACACLVIAAKVEAAAPPPLRAFLRYLSGSYTPAQLQAAELQVLQVLDYRVAHIATTRAFVTSSMVELGATSPLLRHLACYLAELTLLEFTLLSVRASELAAACITYASILLQRQAHSTRAAALPHLGDNVLAQVTGYSTAHLAPTIIRLSAVHYTVTAAAANGRPYASTSKYLSSHHGGVAALPAVLLTSSSSSSGEDSCQQQ